MFKLIEPFQRFLLLSIFIFSFLPGKSKDIYVSIAGNDLNSGTVKYPLKSLQKAREIAIHVLHQNEDSEVTIWLNDGIFRIENPQTFEPVKTGNTKASLTIKAMKNTKPVISGGVELKGWKKNSKGLWETTLDGQFLGRHKQIREIFINNKRATRARFPNEDFLKVKKVGDDKRTNFFFEKGDFPVLNQLAGVELVFLHDWSITRIGVKEIDFEESKLSTVDTVGTTSLDFFKMDGWESNPRYFLENAAEFIDLEYEWVFLPDENKILLKLPGDENPDQLQVVLPISEGLIKLQGNENSPVKNIHFEGITFQNSFWGIPANGYCGVQACHFDPRPSNRGWNVVPAAVEARWAENCSFVNCTFESLGGSGVWFGTGCKNCIIKNSVLTDISGNGIMIGEGQDRIVNGENWWKSSPHEVALGNRIENCSVSDCGKQFYGAVGIWCGLTAETTIKDNQIFDLPYTGISVGWMWSPVPTPCRNNTIDGNHIHHIMQILSDGGGIYMLGLQPGSKILNNHIHDVKINAGRAESNGMFLDEGTTDVVIANNLIYNIAKSPLRFHRATTNLVKDNYLFCQNENPPIRYNTTKEEDIQKVDNHVFTESDINYNEELVKAIKRMEAR
ncbi:MAG: right-handed parallel beta-helix repeat-containing protein [Draconibacterium sp.]